MPGPNLNIPAGQGGVTFPSPNEWPVTYREITGITRAVQARITAPNHGFTSADIPETIVDFTQVKGMQEINGIFASLISISDDNNFIVNINTTNFHTYISGGFVNIMAGNPPFDPYANIA